ncbi:MAG: FTR1 family iron permease [Sedimenticola sp.]|nr:FTR1 family iron permease [Sedimenticola sp.]
MSFKYFIGLLLVVISCAGSAAEYPAVDYQVVVNQLTAAGDRLSSTYSAERAEETADAFSGLYFDIFEGSGMEMSIGMQDPARKSELEAYFSKIIGLASKERPAEQVTAAWQTLRVALEKIANEQKPTDSSFWGLLVQAFLILLREGFEAMLVITALVTYLRRQQATDKVRVIYQGAVLALLASFLTAWLLTVVFEISGAGQEALEGVTMLLAAVVLFYVSYWLISKSEAARWQAFINSQIDQALTRSSTFALGLAAFLAVYREGAETVLFYQALAGQADGSWEPLLIGFCGALVALLVLYKVMQMASFRLPIGLFFTITAVLLYYLAVSFAGNGILELQEAGWVGITPLDGGLTITWLGVYPSVESMAAQLLLVIPLPFALAWWWGQRRQQLVGAKV